MLCDPKLALPPPPPATPHLGPAPLSNSFTRLPFLSNSLIVSSSAKHPREVDLEALPSTPLVCSELNQQDQKFI